MKREYIAQYSQCLHRELHLLVYGHDGIPVLAFPCQDGIRYFLPYMLQN